MPPTHKHALHDRLLSALERLEAKPTQAAAWEELQRLAHDLEPANLPGLLHAASSPSPSSTQFSRVHCARLAALCATPGACPPSTWRALMQAPLLPKLLGLLARSLRDGDAAVRVAAAEGLGVVAAQLAPAPGAAAGACSGSPATWRYQTFVCLRAPTHTKPAAPCRATRHHNRHHGR